MTSIRELHTRAMEAAQLALLAARQGSADGGMAGMRQAYELERQAADQLADPDSPEPTRSIIHRSAASMAIQCGEHEAAERLIARALAGTPPRMVAEQLRDLFEQVSLQRHLDLRGVELGADQVQVSFAGPEIGFGVAPISAIIDRLTTIQRLAERIGERLLGRPFREGGPPPQEVRQVFVTVPRAGSFAVSIKVGEPIQTVMPGFSRGEQVLTEMLDGLALVAADDIDTLHKQIGDEAYFRNFVALAEKIAPDGKQVSQVGFAALRHGQERRVELRASLVGRQVLTELDGGSLIVPGDHVAAPGTQVFVGELRWADEVHEASHKIKIIPASETGGQQWPITLYVQPGMMADIVKPLWGERVVARVTRHGKKLYLEKITRSE